MKTFSPVWEKLFLLLLLCLFLVAGGKKHTPVIRHARHSSTCSETEVENNHAGCSGTSTSILKDEKSSLHYHKKEGNENSTTVPSYQKMYGFIKGLFKSNRSYDETNWTTKLRFHPEDDTSTLNEVFLQDPKRFVPHWNTRTGEVYPWGLPEVNHTQRRIRHKQVQSFGGPFWDGHPMYGPKSSLGILRSPEQQFVDVLMAKKTRTLKAGSEESSRLFGHRMQIMVSLKGVTPALWRRLTVPCGMSLAALHSLVLAPALGWHKTGSCYQFMDMTDGALFGPPAGKPSSRSGGRGRSSSADPHPLSSCRDLDYLPVKGYAHLDDRHVRLSQVVSRAGARLKYIYNLGMYWEHTVVVEAVLAPPLPILPSHLATASSASSSSSLHSSELLVKPTPPSGRPPRGSPLRHPPTYPLTPLVLSRPILLAGAMHCPPDTSTGRELSEEKGGGGNLAYQSLLQVLMDHSHPERREMLAVVSQALNVESGSHFDPFHFHRPTTQRRLDQLWNEAPAHMRTVDLSSINDFDSSESVIIMQRLDLALMTLITCLFVFAYHLLHRRYSRSSSSRPMIRAPTSTSSPIRTSMDREPDARISGSPPSIGRKARTSRDQSARVPSMDCRKRRSLQVLQQANSTPAVTPAEAPCAHSRELLNVKSRSGVVMHLADRLVRSSFISCGNGLMTVWKLWVSVIFCIGESACSFFRLGMISLKLSSIQTDNEVSSDRREVLEMESSATSEFQGLHAGICSNAFVSSECVVCMSAKKGALLQPCGHCHTCYECAMELWKVQVQSLCPVCRTPIEGVIRAYL